MNPINFVPLMIATLSLGYASFMQKKEWVNISFAVWLVLFVLLFYVANP